MTLTVDQTGPFLVSSFGKSGMSAKGQQNWTITWKDGAQKLAKNVKDRPPPTVGRPTGRRSVQEDHQRRQGPG